MAKEKVYQLASDFINAGFNTGREDFLQEMHKLHPTMQQIFAGLVLSWMVDYCTSYGMDDRNRNSMAECRNLMESFRAVNDDRDVKTSFPLV
jgi:hypothetical protein